MSIMTSSNIVELTGQKIDLTTWLGWATWWEASLDMGSGITTLYLQPVKAITKERTERGPIYRLSFPSVVDTGEKLLETIANGRNAPRGRPASVLTAGEFVLRMQNSRYEHLVGSLADLEGEHPTDAKGDPDRYWGEHIKIIACTAICATIPDVHAEVRLNFCMPFTLYSPERKERAMNNLDGLYYCYVNEVYHEIDLRVGTVVPEGFAAITRFGSPTGNNVSIDVGDRTTEIIFASGFKLVSRDSVGRTYGVRQVIEHISDEINQDYGRVLEVEEVRILLKAYTAGMRLPRLKVARGTADGYLDGDSQREIITRKVITMARALAKFIRATINKEGAEIGSNLDTATIYGGGGYLFYGPLKDGVAGDNELENGVLHDLYLPPEAEYLNAAYMQELVAQQTVLKPGMWERKR
ncbi:MAG: ParM/StbA family protein [Ktedonobacteraceae bacterium]